MKMKKLPSVKAVVTLTLICLITAATLGAVNYFTSPIIEKNEIERENAALRQVLPEGDAFDAIDISDLGTDKRVTAVYRESDGKGYVFKVTVNGYSSGLTILCGVGNDGSVTGALCLASSETLGYEKNYGIEFEGRTLANVADVDTVSGATMTTEGYREAVKLALETFEKISK